MRKPLVLLAVLVATSCTLEDVVLTAVDMAGEGTAVHPHLYFDEPMSEVSTTSEPATTVCVRYSRSHYTQNKVAKPGVFTVDVVVKNKTNGFETVIHLVNFDATAAAAKSCAEESVPLEPGVNVIRARAVNGGKAVVWITRETGE